MKKLLAVLDKMYTMYCCCQTVCMNTVSLGDSTYPRLRKTVKRMKMIFAHRERLSLFTL